MNQNEIVKVCRELGCCDACCLRYLGLKNPNSYENVHQFILKYLDTSNTTIDSEVKKESEEKLLVVIDKAAKEIKPIHNTTDDLEDSTDDAPPAKRIKLDNVCVSCLGVLQEETWAEGFTMVQEVLDKKCYECDTIACALSSPIAAILRERAITLRLQHTFPSYEPKSLMPLKEAWKWLFGRQLATKVNKQLDSGAVAPLLVTLSIEYPDDLQELEVLKTLSPALFASRSKQRRRFTVEFTRRSVEQALEGVTFGALTALPPWSEGLPPVRAPARAVSVLAAHAPLYLAGRYIKLSRVLPQTPWLVAGRRMMHSSVQEIIFEAVSAAYGLNPEEAEQKLKFISAGREDVDVRCLGTGRPFALEITDPRRQPSAAELQRACAEINAGGKVLVHTLVPITREDLTQLKQGEESKCKTYEALCIKLAHTKDDNTAVNGSDPKETVVTAEDIANINAYSNTEAGDTARIVLSQRTPVRVLHRRPLLTRTRRIYSINARAVPAHPSLFVVRVRTEAGTYIKEWVHGELRRTRPSLGAAIGAPVDILALDVAEVDLPWPPQLRATS